MTEQLNGTQDYTGWLIDETGARKLFNDTVRRAPESAMFQRKTEIEGDKIYRVLRVNNCATIRLSKMRWQGLWTVEHDSRDNAGLPIVNLEVQNYAE